MANPLLTVVAKSIIDALTPDDDEEGDDGSLLWSVYEPPASTAIRRVKHRLVDGTLTVEFNKAKAYPAYLFINVPRELFRQWKRVKSAGKFYHRRIKDGGYNITGRNRRGPR